jgi:hypothetical protein
MDVSHPERSRPAVSVRGSSDCGGKVPARQSKAEPGDNAQTGAALYDLSSCLAREVPCRLLAGFHAPTCTAFALHTHTRLNCKPPTPALAPFPSCCTPSRTFRPPVHPHLHRLTMCPPLRLLRRAALATSPAAAPSSHHHVRPPSGEGAAGGVQPGNGRGRRGQRPRQRGGSFLAAAAAESITRKLSPPGMFDTPCLMHPVQSLVQQLLLPPHAYSTPLSHPAAHGGCRSIRTRLPAVLCRAAGTPRPPTDCAAAVSSAAVSTRTIGMRA